MKAESHPGAKALPNMRPNLDELNELRRALGMDELTEQRRICLRCDEEFDSVGGTRLCVHCRTSRG